MSDFDGPWGRPEPPPPPRRWHHDRRLVLVALLCVAVLGGLGIWGLTLLFPGRSLNKDEWSTAAYSLGLIALVSLSLFSRRLKITDVVRYVAIWVGVFAILAIGYVYRGEIAETGLRLRAALLPGYAAASADHELVVAQDADGNFPLVAQVNGQPVRFVIDTGASDIVLAPADAKRLGVDLTHLDFARHFETANGAGDGAAYTAASLTAGPIKLANVPMSINRAPMSESLLGMTFLNRLQSAEVKDKQLYLRWRG